MLYRWQMSPFLLPELRELCWWWRCSRIRCQDDCTSTHLWEQSHRPMEHVSMVSCTVVYYAYVCCELLQCFVRKRRFYCWCSHLHPSVLRTQMLFQRDFTFHRCRPNLQLFNQFRRSNAKNNVDQFFTNMCFQLPIEKDRGCADWRPFYSCRFFLQIVAVYVLGALRTMLINGLSRFPNSLNFWYWFRKLNSDALWMTRFYRICERCFPCCWRLCEVVCESLLANWGVVELSKRLRTFCLAGEYGWALLTVGGRPCLP